MVITLLLMTFKHLQMLQSSKTFCRAYVITTMEWDYLKKSPCPDYFINVKCAVHLITPYNILQSVWLFQKALTLLILGMGFEHSRLESDSMRKSQPWGRIERSGKANLVKHTHWGTLSCSVGLCWACKISYTHMCSFDSLFVLGFPS